MNRDMTDFERVYAILYRCKQDFKNNGVPNPVLEDVVEEIFSVLREDKEVLTEYIPTSTYETGKYEGVHATFVYKNTGLESGRCYRCVNLSGIGLKYFEHQRLYTREDLVNCPIAENIHIIS